MRSPTVSPQLGAFDVPMKGGGGVVGDVSAQLVWFTEGPATAPRFELLAQPEAARCRQLRTFNTCTHCAATYTVS